MPGALRSWLAVFGGWTALALFLATSNSLSYRATGRPANWTLSISRSLAEWWCWALLTPLVFWLARTFPLDHPTRRWRHLAALTAAGLVMAFVKMLADRAVFAWLSGVRLYLLMSTLALQFVVFAGIVTAAHGVEYYRRSREREQLEARLSEARLQLLGMQLQPHFLFNTLNTIAEMVHHHPDAADRMIVGLSELLRLTLELRDAQQITLARELDLLERYLEIQRARFGSRLQVQIAAPDDARRALVPALVLQPIVENSIRHGLASSRTAGRIRIDARREPPRRLVIDVVDDGQLLAGESRAGRKGVGLANTRERLDAMYGRDGRLELTSIPGGIRARLDLPFVLPGEPA